MSNCLVFKDTFELLSYRDPATDEFYAGECMSMNTYFFAQLTTSKTVSTILVVTDWLNAYEFSEITPPNYGRFELYFSTYYDPTVSWTKFFDDAKQVVFNDPYSVLKDYSTDPITFKYIIAKFYCGTRPCYKISVFTINFWTEAKSINESSAFSSAPTD